MVDQGEKGWWLWRRGEGRRRSRLSPIVLRILAVNVMALAILVGSLLYLGRYQERLIASDLDAMLLQARLCASAVSEGAVVVDEEDHNMLSPLLARLMIRRLVEATNTRTRLFDSDDGLLVDSRTLRERGEPIESEELPKRDKPESGILSSLMLGFDVIDRLVESRNYPPYPEDENQRGSQYGIVQRAMAGEPAKQVWSMPESDLILAVAVPVQRNKQVLGAIMLSRPNPKIDAAVREVRINILEIFGITLLITVLLSLYLARAIARPIRLLAQAADGVRHGQMQVVGLAGTASLLKRDVIPDLSARHDEIGDLSSALRDMTAALAKRIGAIENFAADVAHEIKNPLTSLRSAVETAERVQDPAMQRRLMLVIRDDVDRLDRLISDSSNASRLDAELRRAEAAPVDVGKMLAALVALYVVHDDGGRQARVVIAPPAPNDLAVMGVEVRLVQVLQNLIANALSFSPPDGQVVLSAKQDGRVAQIMVEDSGPGIPENKLEAIFDRFYSERPKEEKFGTHSGLGLSISKHIVEAHGGKIRAENRRDAEGRIVGARFVLEFPVG